MKINDIDFCEKGLAKIKYWELQDCSDEEKKYNVDLIWKMMKHTHELEPIIVDINNKLLDGFHRITALNELGVKYIIVYKELHPCWYKRIMNLF